MEGINRTSCSCACPSRTGEPHEPVKKSGGFEQASVHWHVFDSEIARVLLLSKLISAQNRANIVTQKSARLVPFVASISPPASGFRPLLTRERLTRFVTHKIHYFGQSHEVFSVTFSGRISADLSVKNTLACCSFCKQTQSRWTRPTNVTRTWRVAEAGKMGEGTITIHDRKRRR